MPQFDKDKALKEVDVTMKEEQHPSKEAETADDPAADEEEEEQWHMKKIMSIADLKNEATIKCSTKDCPLPAAVLYLSDEKSTKWYTCLDCQVNLVLCSPTEFIS